jgi:2-phosphoglycerate kinase
MNQKKLFITGIPTAGKSYLAKKLADEVGGICVSVDNLRVELEKDEKYKKWVNYYLDQDEEIYYKTTTSEERLENLMKQSNGLWSGILNEIEKYAQENKPVIFEGVNILPCLANIDLDFAGIVLLGTSFEETLKRNMAEPRWGETVELQKLEADEFFFTQRPYYKSEAEKFGYPVFETPDEAFATVLEILNNNKV